MKIISLNELKSTSVHKPSGYYEEVVARGKISKRMLLLEDNVYAELRTKFSPNDPNPAVIPFKNNGARPKPQINPTPPAPWPLWARALKVLANPDDKGIGDIVARTIGQENSEAFKAFYRKVTGHDCGCKGRQARWNRIYPLNQ